MMTSWCSTIHHHRHCLGHLCVMPQSSLHLVAIATATHCYGTPTFRRCGMCSRIVAVLRALQTTALDSCCCYHRSSKSLFYFICIPVISAIHFTVFNIVNLCPASNFWLHPMQHWFHTLPKLVTACANQEIHPFFNMLCYQNAVWFTLTKMEILC